MVLGTRMSFTKKCLFYGNMPEILSKFHNQGGAITSFQSTLAFESHLEFNFTDNLARFGGAIYAIKSSLIDFPSDVLLSRSRALEDGGGIYSYQTKIRCYCISTLVYNSANNSGGGI